MMLGIVGAIDMQIIEKKKTYNIMELIVTETDKPKAKIQKSKAIISSKSIWNEMETINCTRLLYFSFKISRGDFFRKEYLGVLLGSFRMPTNIFIR